MRGPSDKTFNLVAERENDLYGALSLFRRVKIASVVGARPQFIKAAPVSREIRQHNEEILVHTGPQSDEELSDAFFEALDMPRPDYDLGVESASYAHETAEMMRGLEDVLERERPDLVLVYGDANATLAGALVAAKMGRPVGHVEAGLRSFDRSMPEEINRIVADHLASLLFCPTPTAVDNLAREGISRGVHLVGDVMYDMALQSAQAARSRDILTRVGVRKGEYVLVTLHRPENVDDRGVLAGIVHALVRSNRTVVFPVHPRTRKNLEAFGLWDGLRSEVKAIEPLDYLDFIALLMAASKVVTDSGGVQREAYFFGVPCITLRDDTEWIETVEDGWNALVGSEPEDILDALEKFNPAGTKSKSFGDGHAAEKIARILDKFV
jgi:UDP-N-acetylglucosamine 2-epimerase (non-hydrolysing)